MKYLIVLFAIVLSALNCKEEKAIQSIDNDYYNAEKRLEEIAVRVKSDLKKINLDETQIPRSLDQDGQLESTKSGKWTSGFYPGILWLTYGFTNEPELKEAGEFWLNAIHEEQFDTGTHDLGFKIYCSYGNAFKTTGYKNYENVIVQAAKSLTKRYSPTVHAIRSWDHNDHLWDHPVIIDNMMNLELLFEATIITGDSIYHNIAVQHANTTLKNHFRKDYSSYHVIDYYPETGKVRKKNTHQGAFDESAWSRGQAWGLYGYTMSYRYTKNELYLRQAVNIAKFILEHENLPVDGIPYWDFNAPDIPNEPRDVSAATVIASALLELQGYDTENANTYIKQAQLILTSLEEAEYQSEIAPFILDHSVGSIPGEFEIDVPIVYADYYYIEALLRYSKLISN